MKTCVAINLLLGKSLSVENTIAEFSYPENGGDKTTKKISLSADAIRFS
jgi:hypothetical protein